MSKKSFTVRWKQIEPDKQFKQFEQDFDNYYAASVWIWEELKSNKGWIRDIEIYENTWQEPAHWMESPLAGRTRIR